MMLLIIQFYQEQLKKQIEDQNFKDDEDDLEDVL